VGTDPLEPADEDTEPRRVEEVDALHVDHEVVLAVGHQVHELLAEPRSGVDVDLATDFDDGAVTLGAGREGEVHKSSSK
jgi:hypothetical protein